MKRNGAPGAAWNCPRGGDGAGETFVPRPARRRKESLPCARGGGTSSQTGVGRVVTGSLFDVIFSGEDSTGYNPPVSKLTAPFAQGGLGETLLQGLTFVPRPAAAALAPLEGSSHPVRKKGTQTQPNVVVVFGRGGARERGSNPTIRCGIADDTHSATTRGIVTCMSCSA